jgi:hypothetical protein
MSRTLLFFALSLAACGDPSLDPFAAQRDAEDRAVQASVQAEYEAEQARLAAEREAAEEAARITAMVDGEPTPTAEDLIPWKRLDTPATAEITVEWTEAADYDGQTIAVEGTIVDTHNSGKACFLNFSKEWQGTFYLAVLGSNMDDYPESPERYFLNKKVRAVGKVAMYRGRPQIVIESPLHITVLGE